MPRCAFVKMHGCGNDYVFIDDGLLDDQVPTGVDLGALSRWVSNRHFGVGSDGLILLSRGETAPVRMRMFNADGSVGKLCLNGLRCAAKYAADRLTELGAGFVIETAAGVRRVEVHSSSRVQTARVRVDAERPDFRRAALPARGSSEELWGEIEPVGDRKLPAYGVSVGNPHLVLWVDAVAELEDVPLEGLRSVSVDKGRFPEGVNVHVVARSDESALRMMSWERGSGPTLACGTGAVAAFAVARRLSAVGLEAVVDMPGGAVSMTEAENGNLQMEGPAEEVFEGSLWV